MTLEAALYLLPVNLSDAPLADVLPQRNFAIASSLKHFIVENVRTARRFLKRCDPSIEIGELTFYELNGHTSPAAVPAYLEPLRRGEPMGVMSEAGCPAVADPGSDVVAIAQAEGLKVVPLVGPSSILMALMASGFNGQGFTFNGYLPIDPQQRVRKIRELEALASRQRITQIFIETPYRNDRMLQTLTDTLRPDTLLCVASAITDPTAESVRTMTVAKWKGRRPQLAKIPSIFLIM